MGIDMSALGEDYEEHKKNEEEQKKGRTGFAKNWRPHEGSRNACFLLPPHKAMKGMPYHMRGSHFKCGPNSDKILTCLRDKRSIPIDKCPQCMEVSKLYSSKKTSSIELGKKRARKQGYLWGAIDMSSFVDEDGALVDMRALPKCFGNYIGDEKTKGFKVCQKCADTAGSWGLTCQIGICINRQGSMLYEPTYKALKRFDAKKIDITDFDTPHMMIIEQKGEDGKGREKYTIIGWEPFKMPKTVAKWINDNLPDLSKVFPPKSKEEMKAIMAGVEYEEEDAGDSTELPKCFGDAKIFDKGGDECQGCEAFELCASELEGEEDPSLEGSEAPEEEEPEAPEAEAPEAEEESIDLSALGRKELKKLIEVESLSIIVYRNMSDDDVRKAIHEIKSGEPEPEGDPLGLESNGVGEEEKEEETKLEGLIRERNEAKSRQK